MKILIILVALVLLVWLLLGSSRRRAKGPRRPAAGESPSRPTAAVEGMVACVHCGVHLPSSQALTVRGQVFCSAAHRDAGPRAP